MIKCVRCGQMVDEATRTTCPHCFTPLVIGEGDGQAVPNAPAEAPPPMQFMPGTVIGNKRVSLTGELIEIDPPTSKPAYAGGSPTPMAPPPPPQPPTAPVQTAASVGVRKTVGVKGKAPVASAPLAPPPMASATSPAPPPVAHSAAPPPPNMAPQSPVAQSPAPRPAASAPIRPASSAPQKSSSGTSVFAILLLIVVLGAGGYWFMQNRTNPKDNAEKWLRALLTKDYKTVATLTNVGANAKTKTAEDWKQAMQKKADLGQLGNTSPEELFAQLNVHIDKVGEPVTSDSGTTVPIMVKASLMGQEITQENKIPMKKVSGVWKVDLPDGNVGSFLKQ